jgi:hypothetical protein
LTGDRHEQFVSEEMKPVAGTAMASLAARGRPGLPQRFLWRGREYRVVAIMEEWKTTGRCDHGADELYVRRHWFRIATEPQAVMTVYCDRQAKDRRHPKSRWWIYSATP